MTTFKKTKSEDPTLAHSCCWHPVPVAVAVAMAHVAQIVYMGESKLSLQLGKTLGAGACAALIHEQASSAWPM